MEKIWIRNGILVDGSFSFTGEMIVAGGKIVEVGEALGKPDGEVTELDAGGNFVFPGGLDPHVHLELPTPAGPSSDDFLSGTRAALLGGTTSIIDFVTPSREQSLPDAFLERKAFAEKSLIDYTFHMGLSGWHPTSDEEMRQCVHDYGINSFKAYLAYRATIGVDYAGLENILRSGQKLDSIVCVHCEDGSLIQELQENFIKQGLTTPRYHALSRPAMAEVSAVEEVIKLSAKTGCAVYLVHMSAAGSVAAIEKAKLKGLNITAETCPQYLLLDESLYERPLPESLAYIMSPPLRQKTDRDRLWLGLQQQTIDVVSTDHCPFNIKGQKDAGLHDFTKVPNGGAGIQTRLSLLYTYGVCTGKISMEKFVELVSVAPARAFGLWPRKGSLLPGSDADLVIWDPGYRESITFSKLAQHCDHTPFEGLEIVGRPGTVICGGGIAVANGRLSGAELHGRFLARNRQS